MSQDYTKQVKNFFDYKQEKELNKRISKGDFKYNQEELFLYMQWIVEIPIEQIMRFIIEYEKRQPLLAADVFQFSNFEDATVKICDKLKNTASGLGFIDIGRLLLDDGIERNDVALRKYGENHIKTAELLGLVFKSEKKYYLSCIGLIFNNLPESIKEQLLIRLILRNKLINQILLAANQETFDLEAYLYDLSHSTYIRRRPNIKCIMNRLLASTEYDFCELIEKIVF